MPVKAQSPESVMSIAASHEGKSKSKSPAVLKDADFNWEDPLDLDGELTEEERMVRDTARGFAQDKLMPRVLSRLARGAGRPRILPEMARSACSARPSRRNTAAPAWAMSAMADRARARARRFRLPLDAVGAVLAGDASDLCLWQRGAAQEISAQARKRRAGRLLRPDRARLTAPIRLDGDARPEGAGRLQAHRRQDVDLEFADRRHRRGLGEARRQDPRLHRRARHEGFLDAEGRGQASLRTSVTGEIVLDDAWCRRTICCRT